MEIYSALNENRLTCGVGICSLDRIVKILYRIEKLILQTECIDCNRRTVHTAAIWFYIRFPDIDKFILQYLTIRLSTMIIYECCDYYKHFGCFTLKLCMLYVSITFIQNWNEIFWTYYTETRFISMCCNKPSIFFPETENYMLNTSFVSKAHRYVVMCNRSSVVWNRVYHNFVWFWYECFCAFFLWLRIGVKVSELIHSMKQHSIFIMGYLTAI